MESEIMALFNAALKSLADSIGIQYVFPYTDEIDGDGNAKQPSGTHLRVAYMPVTPESIHVEDGSGFRKWIIQVDVVALRGKGQFVASRIVDQVVAAYPCLHEFVGTDHRYRVEYKPTVAASVPHGRSFFIPISLTLMTYTKG